MSEYMVHCCERINAVDRGLGGQPDAMRNHPGRDRFHVIGYRKLSATQRRMYTCSHQQSKGPSVRQPKTDRSAISCTCGQVQHVIEKLIGNMDLCNRLPRRINQPGWQGL